MVTRDIWFLIGIGSGAVALLPNTPDAVLVRPTHYNQLSLL